MGSGMLQFVPLLEEIFQATEEMHNIFDWRVRFGLLGRRVRMFHVM